MRYVCEHLAVAFSAISGVLAARGRKIDLFGVLVLAMVTATGGGTLRDVLLDLRVFWIDDSRFLVTVMLCGAATFAAARVRPLPQRWLLIADAFGLALVTVLGTLKALNQHETEVIAIVLGVLTGTAGGMMRDVLCGEIPLVFRREIYLYATAAACGATLLCLLRALQVPPAITITCSASLILALRLAALRWRLALPLFETKD